MPLQIGDLFRILKRRQPKALYVATIGLTTGFAPDQRQRVMQLVIRDAQAPHDPSGAGLRALQAAAGGGAAIIRLLAKAVIAAAGNWWRTYTIRRARIAAVRELHALDDRTLSDIGVSRSEIEWVVVHGRDAPRVHWASQSRSSHTSSSAEKSLRTRKVSACAGGQSFLLRADEVIE